MTTKTTPELTPEQNGLRLAAGVTIAFGLAMALAAYPPLSGPMVLLADILIWPMDGVQTGSAPELRLTLAIAGGVMVGWGWMIWRLAGEFLTRNAALTRRIIRQSTLTWFAIDSTASVLAGVPLNAVANLAFLALFLVPMQRGRATHSA